MLTFSSKKKSCDEFRAHGSAKLHAMGATAAALARGSGRSSPFTFTVPIAKAEARASTLVGSATPQAMGATLAAAEARASTLVGSASRAAGDGRYGRCLL